MASAPESLVEVCEAELTLAVLMLLEEAELVADVMMKLVMELAAAMVLAMVLAALELAMLESIAVMSVMSYGVVQSRGSSIGPSKEVALAAV